MSDFNSEFWSWYITLPTILGLLACFWMLRWLSVSPPPLDGDGPGDTGHVWDGDLRELNNPLPRWWLGLFYISLVFGGFYLLLYPGLGSYAGWLDWSSKQEYEQEVRIADAKFGPIFRQFQGQDLAVLSKDTRAKKIGERLFINHCATCHGSDARGARGFPNLRDNAWLWGGSSATIEQSILDGRSGLMPAWELPLGGEQGVSRVTEYVLSLAGREHDPALASAGKAQFDLFCFACHGSEGKGNQALGAPDLTDASWLYGSSRLQISESIAKGRNGVMPAQRNFLGEAKVHLLAAYIYGLSGTD